MKLKTFAAVAAFVGSSLIASIAQAEKDSIITVFKTPWCGCCAVWTEAMEKAGYTVKVNDMEDLSLIKKQASVPENLESCHTAVLGEYILEGHVPLDAVEKLMTERPKVRGISVPGMPQGSLGMGYDKNAQYTVYSFDRDVSKPPAVYFESGK